MIKLQRFFEIKNKIIYLKLSKVYLFIILILFLLKHAFTYLFYSSILL